MDTEPFIEHDMNSFWSRRESDESNKLANLSNKISQVEANQWMWDGFLVDTRFQAIVPVFSYDRKAAKILTVYKYILERSNYRKLAWL